MNENLPKVTIITATFNLIKNGRENFFRECVESVHNQTYQNIEHLIIDGASTDGTLDIIKEYEDKGWLKCYSEPDKGMCDAMNKGIKKATGEYIGILNSDDNYATNEAIELSIKSILENNADYSYSSTYMLSRNENKIIRMWDSSEAAFNQFWLYMPFNHETMLCKKKVYEKENYYEYEKYGTSCDFYFVLKLIINDYRKAYVNTPILNFRMDGSTNFTNIKNISKSYKEHIEMLYKLYIDFWSQFLDKKTIKKIKKILDNSPIGPKQDLTFVTHSDLFLNSLFNFLLKKNLKNFSYESLKKYIEDNSYKIKKYFFIFTKEILSKQDNDNFIEYINIKIANTFYIINIINNNLKKFKKYYFCKILILKIQEKNNKKIYKLFGFLPIIVSKIK